MGHSAGIGGGKWSNCGDITISGGNVQAIAGKFCAGIGCGVGDNTYPSSCGNITITTGVIGVASTKNNARYSIGSSDSQNGRCGKVIVGGLETNCSTQDVFVYFPTNETICTICFDANGGTGTIADQNYYYYRPNTLPECTFNRTGYTFTGWNTAANGSGLAAISSLRVVLSLLQAAVRLQASVVHCEANAATSPSLMT